MRVNFFVAITFLIPSIAISSEPRQKTISTPDGSISMTSKAVAPFPQKITLASPAEVARFNAHAAKGASFVSAYLPNIKNIKEPTLKDFDEAFYLWLREKKQRYSSQQVVEILGSRLGKKLINDFDMEWVLVEDEYGTDYAVRAKKKETMSFPFSSVLKRIESNEHDFMVGVYQAVKSTIDESDVKTR